MPNTKLCFPGYGLNAILLNSSKKKERLCKETGGRLGPMPLVDILISSPVGLQCFEQSEILAALTQAKRERFVVFTLHGVQILSTLGVNTHPNRFGIISDLSESQFKVIHFKDFGIV